MTPFFRHAGLLLALAAGPALAQDSEAGLQAVAALARANGQALACHDSAAAQRAKALMLAHAPKTARYAQVFDDGTQQAWLATGRGETPCPDGKAFTARLDTLAAQLQASLPVAAR